MRESIYAEEQKFIEEFNELEDWMFQYEYLLELAGGLEKLPGEFRSEAYRVKDCQSGVWLKTEISEDGIANILADSEALIIKGLVAIPVSLLNGRSAEEISDYVPRFLDETQLHRQISTDRFKGILSVIDAIRHQAADKVRTRP